MGDTNYLASIVKILEKPLQKVINEKITRTEFRAQLGQARTTRIVKVVFWGNLARDITSYYHINDYIMIEGFLSLHDKKNKTNKVIKSKLKEARITVVKIYPVKN